MVTRNLPSTELFQNNLLTIQEVAEWAKVSTKTMYGWISDNKIPAIQLGNQTYRIPKIAIIAYLKQLGYDHLVEWSQHTSIHTKGRSNDSCRNWSL